MEGTLNLPDRTIVMHFTHIDHLETVLSEGLMSDTLAQANGLLTVEVGMQGIKQKRAGRAVPVRPGGVVGDYAPFYFAARSPMMSSIHHGRVPTYQDGCDELIYLVTSVQHLKKLGLDVVLTDRNAVLDYAEFWNVDDGELEPNFIDWPLMKERIWRNTDEYPDRRERRMAECLVHECVPQEAFKHIVAKSPPIAARAESAVTDSGLEIPVSVRPGWYF